MRYNSILDIYISFAQQSGGYERVQFEKKNMYNQIDKQSTEQGCDVEVDL